MLSTIYGTEWPISCWCAIKKLLSLTHWLTPWLMLWLEVDCTCIDCACMCGSISRSIFRLQSVSCMCGWEVLLSTCLTAPVLAVLSTTSGRMCQLLVTTRMRWIFSCRFGKMYCVFMLCSNWPLATHHLNPGQLSLAIPPWVGKMSTGNDYSHIQGRNGEFCVTVGPVIRTAGILTLSITWWTWAVC